VGKVARKGVVSCRVKPAVGVLAGGLREEERETREKGRRENERGDDPSRLPYVAVNRRVVAANAFAARLQ
jgi:hypothetical protein